MLGLLAFVCMAELRGQSAAALLLPSAVAYDSTGDLFFADAKRHEVFELTLAGAWSIAAGTGEQGFAGDGGPATAALLDTPEGLAVAADGTLYIADTGNQRIRRVSNGVISTVAGSGVRGYSGDGSALQTALRDPTALALDASGNLLLCDTGNERVRQVISGSIITIAGTGVQGYSGDGSQANAAELDTPFGVAVAQDGTILIADTQNQRIRAISSGGTIATFAGTGVKSFAGDGGQAKLAALSLPLGVAIGSNGSVLIADTGNQRIRSVSAQGVITTIAGNGVQGIAVDRTPGQTAALNSPRAISMQMQGQPVLADSSNGLVRELANDNALYTLALLAAPRASSVTLIAGASTVYGQGAARVSVSGSAATPQGTVALLDSGTALSSAQLGSGSASFNLGELGTGTHVLSATYAGDGLNGGASSAPTPLVVAAAPALATANAATAVYGGTLPPLTGTLTGILPQDSASVHAQFFSAAGVLSPVGGYPITAILSGQGSANYVLSMGASSGSLVISQAPSATSLSTNTQVYAGLPVLLSANVASTTMGVPSGSVDFLDGSAVVGNVSIVNGTASTGLLSVPQGAHVYSARYLGDTNFLASTSVTTNVTVVAMPDFNVTVASGGQSVQGGSAAVYTINVSPQNGPFTGAVVLSVSGLPQGATATFSPTAVVPGSSGASVTLSIQTVSRSGALRSEQRIPISALIGLVGAACVCGFFRRRPPVLFIVLLSALAMPNLGCGTRSTGSSVSGGQTFSIAVSGTGTNLAGAAVSHSAITTLTVY